MKKILFIHPKIEFELTLNWLWCKIFWYLIDKGKIKHKFYDSSKRMKGQKFNAIIINEYATLK